MQVATPEFLCGDDLAGGRFHQRRAAEEDGALVAHDDRFVAHGRHVGATGGARAQHRSDLRDPLRTHRGLVVEDPPEVLAVREDLVLAGQERSPGVDEIHAGQPVLQRDLLCAQMLLDRDGIVGATLDRRIVGHDHAFPPRHPTDAGDHARARAFVVVHPVGGQGGEFEERAARIEQAVDPVAWQQLAPADVAVACPLRPAQRGGGQFGAQLLDQREMVLTMGCPRCHRRPPQLELMTTNRWYVNHD